ncbi:MAG TPA: mycothione reductase [Acidimicrobiaceae bacterium]|nr:mycothione reductase [Acidimicrobiaceae bacterium]
MSDAGAAEHFDLVVVGTGSANSVVGPEFDDWSVAIVERGVFGGTCLNVGCIPSKMLVYAADVATAVAGAGAYGIDARIDGVDWPAIRDRVFGRIDPLAAGGRDYRRGPECPNVTVFEGDARFVGEKRLAVRLNEGAAAAGGTVEITGRHIVLGTGARPFVPPVPGLSEVPYHTSDTVMRLAELPRRMIVLGGGYVACELGYVFAALGTETTVVNRSGALLRAEDDDVSAAFTEAAAAHFDLRLNAAVVEVAGAAGTGGEGDATGVRVDIERARGSGPVRERLEADVLLVATGRVPNGDQLDLDAGGVRHDGGRVLADDNFRTNVEGVWAFGDLSSRIQLKHLANAQARAVKQNLLAVGRLSGKTAGKAAGETAGAGLASVPDKFVPHAVFSHPQVAAVGLTERAARAAGLSVVTARRPYGDTAYGWAMEDTASFAKLIADADTGLLVGAHIIGPQAATLIQPLTAAMEFDLDVSRMARGQFYIHPALTEVVENCLLDLVEQLPAPRN